MALTSCTGSIAKSFADSCSSPLEGGYTGRALIFDARDIAFTFDASNPRKVTAITITEDKVPFAVINDGENPFTGSNLASNVEDGTSKYTKTVQFLDPKRGAAASADIDALKALPLGFVVVAEKQDRVADGGYEIIGAYRGLKVNSDGVTRDEYANGGAYQVVASTKERYSEVCYVLATHAAELEWFEARLAEAPAQ